MSWRHLILVLPLLSCQESGSREPQAASQDASAELELQPVDPTAESAILITIDTLRADYVGAYGGPAKTPVMDELAREGWMFAECFASSMLTNPSHASIMTSLYPRDHGVYDNESGIADGVHTLATALQRKGVRTAAVIGFPHLNPDVSNLGQGFERIVPARGEEPRADDITESALGIIDELGENAPFFLWLHYVDPHAPYEPPPSHPPREPRADERTPLSVALQVAPGFQRNNPWFKTAFRKYGSIEAMRQRYVAEIEATDAGLGKLVEGLKKRKLWNSTALVLTADHGENMGEHELFFHHGGLYRAAVHVPLIIRVPHTESKQIEAPVQGVDLTPTILSLMQVPRWEPMRGQNLVPVALGEKEARPHVFSEHMLAQQVAVRGAEGALILHRKSTKQFPSYPFEKGKREVYAADDALEANNLGENAPRAASLSSALDGYLKAGLQMKARPAVNQDRDSLRALGYIE